GKRLIRGLGAGLLLALAAAGCAPGTAELSGKVTYRGQALPGGTVTVYCQDGQIVSGHLGADGSYRIAHLPPGPAKLPAASPPPAPGGLGLRHEFPPAKGGPNLSGPDETQAAPGGGKYVPIPERYRDPEQSGLALTLSPGDQAHNINLHP